MPNSRFPIPNFVPDVLMDASSQHKSNKGQSVNPNFHLTASCLGETCMGWVGIDADIRSVYRP